MSEKSPPELDPVRTDAVSVRPACLTDHPLIVEFNARLALETEETSLDRDRLSTGVLVALNDPGRLRYWVAEHDRRVLGQAAITREWSDWRNGWLWWFQSVYVVPEARGRGVFRALHAEIRRLAREAGDVVGLRLYVEEHNARARRVYEAMGLVPGGYHVFEELWEVPEAQEAT